MPVYDYRCDNCGEFEKWLQISELDSPVQCSSCDQVANRLISAPNISLNNGRFPQNDQTPQVVTRKRSAPPRRLEQVRAGRPWMVSHSPARY
ncbi:zinc ribbon domain-containing protein [Acaryochloris sp. IP29b_bin.137]|uniref:FmdB family zinc ribbon protein n=1 Tax=Acaryochloris sp. IP29b_bin.137 TaxID=2969217 RepID=UPI002615A58D|nr:zinc ribbon domain-containing protein [Acaryochloris sp. IP29b_bin.137]